jgi:hypothetical protein
MTLAQIKEEAIRLPYSERFVLQVYLEDYNEEHDKDFVHSVTENMRDMDVGLKISLEEVEAQHEKLAQMGR